MTRQLRLVVDEQNGGAAQNAGPAERVFAHWVWMMAKSARRTALGPTRRKVLATALALYDEDTLRLAIDGCAGSAWHAGDNERGVVFNDLTLILRDEAHIERFAEMGELLHRKVAAQAQADARAAVPRDAVSDVEAQAQRKAVRALAMQLAGRAR